MSLHMPMSTAPKIPLLLRWVRIIPEFLHIISALDKFINKCWKNCTLEKKSLRSILVNLLAINLKHPSKQLLNKHVSFRKILWQTCQKFAYKAGLVKGWQTDRSFSASAAATSKGSGCSFCGWFSCFSNSQLDSCDSVQALSFPKYTEIGERITSNCENNLDTQICFPRQSSHEMGQILGKQAHFIIKYII